MSFRNNVVTKKLVRYLNNGIRPVRLLNFSEDDWVNAPPILVNSFPKSGTHLLHQILISLPEVKDYGNFLASTPSFTFKEISPTLLNRRLGQILPNEIVASHLHFDDCYIETLKKRNIFKLFIYRDLRDVTISEAHYLSSMNKWHKLSPYFKNIDSTIDRVKLSLNGLSSEHQIEYPNIVKRFEKYSGWLKSKDTLVLKFEDLVSESGVEKLRLIAEKYLNLIPHKEIPSVEEFVLRFQEAINPKKSHTFRSGKRDQWKNIYDDSMMETYQRYLNEVFTDEEIKKYQLI